MAVPSNVPTVGQFSFTLKQGSDTQITMTWLDDNENAINLTGYSMKMQIRAFLGSPVALLTLSSASTSGSYIALGGSAGTITLIFSHTDTATLQGNGQPTTSAGSRVVTVGVYDLQFIAPDGTVGYLIEGTVSLDRQVTQ